MCRSSGEFIIFHFANISRVRLTKSTCTLQLLLLGGFKSKVPTWGWLSLIVWLRIRSDSKTFFFASAPPPQTMEIFKSDSALTLQNCKFYSNIYTSCLTVLLNVRQCLFCLMRQKHCYVCNSSVHHAWMSVVMISVLASWQRLLVCVAWTVG